jgi:hypothetical protein
MAPHFSGSRIREWETHTGGDKIDRSIDRSHPADDGKWSCLTNDHCDNHDDDRDEDNYAMTTIHAIHGLKGSLACPTAICTCRTNMLCNKGKAHLGDGIRRKTELSIKSSRSDDDRQRRTDKSFH